MTSSSTTPPGWQPRAYLWDGGWIGIGRAQGIVPPHAHHAIQICLAHLFREEVGLPFRRYVLWRKLSRAMLLIGRGSSLTEAAYASGFADSAHLTRTFRQMFGIPPTVMMGGGEFYEIPAPFELPARAG